MILITNGGTDYTTAPIVKITGTVKTENKEEGNVEIYSTALKQDVVYVESYAGFGIPIFFPHGELFTNSARAGWAFAAGAKIHPWPVYIHPARNRYNLNGMSRFSVTVGAVLGKLFYKNSEIKQLSDFVNPIFGIDIEPFEYLSVHIGTVLGMQESIYPSSSEKRLVAGLFFGINLTPSVFKEASKNSSGFKFPVSK